MICTFNSFILILKVSIELFLAVKRLMREAQELAEPTYDYFAQPLSDNLFEWHFTVRGPADTDYDGGVYHGRIVLPPDYPMKPPNIIVLTVYSLLIFPLLKFIHFGLSMMSQGTITASGWTFHVKDA